MRLVDDAKDQPPQPSQPDFSLSCMSSSVLSTEYFRLSHWSVSRADMARFIEFSRADPGRDRTERCFTDEFGFNIHLTGAGAGVSAGTEFKARKTR